MRNTALALMCVVALGVTTTFASQSSRPQQPSGQTPSAAAGQQRQRPSASGSADQSITVLGCVYEASDAPNTFAIKGMNDTVGKTPPVVAEQAASPDPQARSDSVPAPAKEAAIGTSGTLQNVEGAWFRLARGSTETLKSLVGQRVQIMGRVKRGKDERGADVVIHRIEPDKMVVTAIDLRPAPELDIMSVQPIDGSCAGGSSQPTRLEPPL